MTKRPRSNPHPRPPWWPEDETWTPLPWEPRHRRRPGAPVAVPEEDSEGAPAERRAGAGWEPWGRRRGGDVRRGFGCLIALMSTLVVSIGVLILWLLAGLLGVASMEGPLAYLARPAGLILFYCSATTATDMGGRSKLALPFSLVPE